MYYELLTRAAIVALSIHSLFLAETTPQCKRWTQMDVDEIKSRWQQLRDPVSGRFPTSRMAAQEFKLFLQEKLVTRRLETWYARLLRHACGDDDRFYFGEREDHFTLVEDTKRHTFPDRGYPGGDKTLFEVRFVDESGELRTVVLKAKKPEGLGTASVQVEIGNGLIYVTETDYYQSEFVISAFDVESGSLRWSHRRSRDRTSVIYQGIRHPATSARMVAGHDCVLVFISIVRTFAIESIDNKTGDSTELFRVDLK